MGVRRRSPAEDRSLHWWHLTTLFVLVAAVEGGTELLAGSSPLQALQALPHSLYSWCPILAGVAISIRRADARTARAAIGVGVAVTILMILFDVAGGLAPSPRQEAAAMTSAGLSSMGTGDTGASWVVTGVDWIRGDLPGVGEQLGEGEQYLADQPRRRAAEALLDSSLVPLVFAVLGLVLAVGQWIRERVRFDREQDERGAHVVVAWLLAPMALSVVLNSAEDLRAASLFRGGPLWAILLPPLGMLAVGVSAWVWSAKQARLEEEPPDPSDDI